VATVPSWGHGKYATSGGRLIAARFDELTAGAFFASPAESPRGFEARLRYLLGTDSGARALAAAGIGKGGKAQFVDWLTGDVVPTRATMRHVDTAYRGTRRRNVAADLKRRLARDGRGTKITVEVLPPDRFPPEQRNRRRQVEDRETTVRPSMWNRLVDAWAQGDFDEMDDAWMDICDDLGSPPEEYFEVAHIGFSA
jgi:hypothetical protein